MLRVHPELEADLKRLKQKPPKTTNELISVLLGTVFPYMLEIADFQREHEMMHRDSFDRLEVLEEATGVADEEPDTRIRPEHATDLLLLVTYAREMAQKMLDVPEDKGGPVPGSTAYLELQALVAKAEASLIVIDESTIDPEDDDEEPDDAEEIVPEN